MKKEIESIVLQIPHGKVTSYGRVAQLLDIQYSIHTSGRMVGKIMNTILKDNGVVPRWRVVNREGYISTNKLGHVGILQQQLLEREGVEVINETVDMKKYKWNG